MYLHGADAKQLKHQWQHGHICHWSRGHSSEDSLRYTTGKGGSYVEAQVEGYAHVDKGTRVHI